MNAAREADEPAAADSTDLTTAAALFKSFADPSRLVITRHLLLGEHRVADLVEHLGLAQSTVSAHIACLRDCGLLSARVRGRATHCSPSPSSRASSWAPPRACSRPPARPWLCARGRRVPRAQASERSVRGPARP